MQSPDVEFIDRVLSDWRGVIGAAYPGYRNHVVRMVTFCLALHPCSEDDKQKIQISACFHDLGIWTENTLDYLPPSVPPAHAYLEKHGLGHWAEEVQGMILEHHKLTAVSVHMPPLVEVFRKGDLVDFSLGLVRFGLPRSFVREVKAEYPNAGFHKNLLRLAGGWFIRHPLNPAPMMKW